MTTTSQPIASAPVPFAPTTRLRAAEPWLASRADTWLSPLAPLATRVVFGQSFALTGFGKLTNLDGLVGFFTELGIPLPSLQAPMVATLEFVGGLLLVLGLGTRVVALALIGTMVVALLTADRGALGSAVLWQQGFADVTPLPFLIGLLWLAAKGPGRISGDALLAARRAH
jgi:putative oxidoreductase